MCLSISPSFNCSIQLIPSLQHHCNRIYLSLQLSVDGMEWGGKVSGSSLDHFINPSSSTSQSIHSSVCLSVHPSTPSIKDKRRWRPYNMGHQICNSRVNYILSGTDIWDTEGHQCISFKKVHHCKRITMETMPPSVHPTVLPWFYTIHLSSLWPSISPSTGVEQG